MLKLRTSAVIRKGIRGFLLLLATVIILTLTLSDTSIHAADIQTSIASWERIFVDFTPNGGLYGSSTYDGNGYLHATYVKKISQTNASLYYASQTDAGWVVKELDIIGHETHSFASIKVDANNHPHIGYFSSDRLKYAFYDGTSWNLSYVGTEGGRYGSLDLNQQGYPNIAWCAGRVIKYASWNGSAWDIQTVGAECTSEGDYFGNVGLALDSHDIPLIASTTSLAISGRQTPQFSTWNPVTNSWETEAIEDEIYTYNGASAIAVDNQDHPLISYCSLQRSVVYAFKTELGWNTTPVTGCTPGVDCSNKCHSTSIAVDADNTPSIAWGLQGAILNYSYLDEQVWKTEVVLERQLSLFPSLNILPSGDVYIFNKIDFDDGYVFLHRRAVCYPLTITHTGEGQDPVANPRKSYGCPEGQYSPGQSISLTANPAINYQVEKWEGTNNDASTSTINSVTMPESAWTVIAHYKLPPTCNQLTLSHEGQGSDPDPNPRNSPGCPELEYYRNELIHLTASPISGWWVKDWLGPVENHNRALDNQLIMPDSPATVSIVYAKLPDMPVIISPIGWAFWDEQVFTWHASADADYYRLVVFPYGLSQAFLSLEVATTNCVDGVCEIRLNPGLAEGQYSYRVIAFFNDRLYSQTALVDLKVVSRLSIFLPVITR